MATNRVNTKEPFSLVYSLNKHPNLGYLIDVNAVQHLPNGMYFLTLKMKDKKVVKKIIIQY